MSVITGWEQQSRNMYMHRVAMRCEVENRTTMEAAVEPDFLRAGAAVATGVARTAAY